MIHSKSLCVCAARPEQTRGRSSPRFFVRVTTVMAGAVEVMSALRSASLARFDHAQAAFEHGKARPQRAGLVRG